MLLAQERTDGHEGSRTGLALCAGGFRPWFSDLKVEVDQERPPRRVVIVLVDHMKGRLRRKGERGATRTLYRPPHPTHDDLATPCFGTWLGNTPRHTPLPSRC